MLPTPGDLAQERVERLNDAFLAIIAAAATLCFAWAGYQSAEWVRERFLLSDESAALSEQALEISAEADRLEERDTVLYVEWLIALDAGEEKAAATIFSVFRPEAQAYFNAAPTNDDGLPAEPPFDDPDYDVNQKRQEAIAVDAESRQLSAESREASQTGARYGGLGLLFAGVLAIAGIASRFNRGRSRTSMMTVAVVLLLFGMFGLLVSPLSFSVFRVRPAPRHSVQGLVMTEPRPPHVGHVVRMRRNIWAWMTSPAPLQVPQVSTSAPGARPSPPHVSQ